MDEYKTLLEILGLKYDFYPNNKLLNVTDSDGIIQSYYCTTGTAIFRDSNNVRKQNRVIKKNFPFERFVALCKGNTDDDILNFFGGLENEEN